MCQRITCKECGKPGFVGCGRHVEQVLGGVAVADRCHCGGVQQQTNPAPADDGGRGILDWVTDFISPRGRRNDR
jgi:hypothetical protein